MTALCQNGLPVLTSAQCVVYQIGQTVKVRLAPGPEGELLAHFARWFDANIRDLDPGILDDWGWADRLVRGSETDVSNHGGGYAVDLNATKWALGSAASIYLTGAEIAKVHAQLKVYDGVLRWGGDYTGRTDPMHFEVIGSRAANARVWAKLNTTTEDDLPSPDDLFNAAIFTDNLGTPQERKIRLRDVLNELREAAERPAGAVDVDALADLVVERISARLSN